MNIRKIPDEAYILYIDGERHRKVYRTLGHAKCALTNFGFGCYSTAEPKFKLAVIVKLAPEYYHEFVPAKDERGFNCLKEVGLNTNGE